MTAFGIYAVYKGWELDPTSKLATIGAFPAWMASRHVEKGRK
jgi:hypothetical protein